nr:MAG TPA: hypothetical protein [Caudoviricetes sp.]DAX26066.1 MAG TPA: hypothetical protein [Caudoviricetes sp.]
MTVKCSWERLCVVDQLVLILMIISDLIQCSLRLS